MAEPTPFFHCLACAGTTFRIPLEHPGVGFMLVCAKCGENVEAPQQEYEADYLRHCAAEQMKRRSIDVCSG